MSKAKKKQNSCVENYKYLHEVLYKVKLSNSKKAAHIMRLGKVKYADVLTTKKRVCRQHDKRSCKSKELLECMINVWKMRRGIPNEGSTGKTVNKVALANLQNGNKNKGFQGNCHICNKKEHKSVDCRAPKKEKKETYVF